ncbi:MAG: hypothetical protein AAF609_18250 [Cyanobacteria bacterium P01_C01_bin.120]
MFQGIQATEIPLQLTDLDGRWLLRGWFEVTAALSNEIGIGTITLGAAQMTVAVALNARRIDDYHCRGSS